MAFTGTIMHENHPYTPESKQAESTDAEGGETHKDSGHKDGFSILFPLSRNLGMATASRAGYGARPRLNTSQHVTPNDH